MAKYVVTIARPPPGYDHGESFREVANTIVHGLCELGHEVVRGVTYGDYAWHEPEVTPIVLGWTMLGSEKPRSGSVLYNLEQPGSPWLSPLRSSILRSYRVWDWSLDSRRELEALGIDVEGVLPISYAPTLEQIDPLPEEQKTIDVLFYGSISPRRQSVLDECRRLGLQTWHLFGTYGSVRDRHIADARVVLNMHYHEGPQAFEWVRVSYLLANRCAVVSEEPVPGLLRDGMLYASKPNLPPAIQAVVGDPDLRRSLGEVGQSAMKRLPIAPMLEPLVGRNAP